MTPLPKALEGVQDAESKEYKRYLRVRRYKHNLLQGAAASAASQMRRIASAESATRRQVKLAMKIESMCRDLALSLRNYRQDPEGLVVMKHKVPNGDFASE